MKVLLIGFTKMAYMPYMNFYIEEFKKNNWKIELLYWKRDNKDDIDCPNDVSTHMFKFEQEDSVPLIKKTSAFLKYRKYASGILRNNKYDLIVVLHSTPGVLLYDLLKKKYKYKYILDYRDFTYENINAYKNVIKNLVENSYCTFVSSNGYLKYLPKSEKIHISHNIITSNLKNRDEFKIIQKRINPIKIRFWGFIRHKDINISVIENLANDDRYELHYHGREQATARELKEYCKNNKIKNVFFHGEYKPEERLSFALDTDLLHNMYDNDVKTINAMGNKFYDGIIFNIPQLCTKGSFMGETAKLNGVGNTFEPYKNTLAEDIYKYYNSIDVKKFQKNCDKVIEKVVEEYELGRNIIKKIR